MEHLGTVPVTVAWSCWSTVRHDDAELQGWSQDTEVPSWFPLVSCEQIWGMPNDGHRWTPSLVFPALLSQDSALGSQFAA